MNPRPYFATILCLFASLTIAPSFAAEPDPQQTVAIVNDQPITAAEVTRETPAADRSTAEARKAALEKLIDDVLLVQEFRKKGSTVPANFIKERTKAIVDESFAGDQVKFEAQLARQGFSLQDFEKIQEAMIVTSTMRHEIAKSETDPAAKKQAIAAWLAAARANATIIYK